MTVLRMIGRMIARVERLYGGEVLLRCAVPFVSLMTSEVAGGAVRLVHVIRAVDL